MLIEVLTMRARLVHLAWLATCAALVLGAAQAGVGASAASAPAAQASASVRTWRLTLSPAPDDLALAEIRFRGPARARLSRRSLAAAVSGPFGDDLLAVAGPRFATPGGPWALVLLVDRPSPLLDPASVALRLSARRSLGEPTSWKLTDLFAHPLTMAGRAPCGLPLHGSPLSGSELRALGSRGAPLEGFATADAVAQAYDVACGLPYSSSFKELIAELGSGSQPPTPVAPTPEPAPMPTPTPAPLPTPPVGKLPGEGCVPTPGRACPEVVRGLARAVVGDGAGRAAVGAH
jgi:hypothetical protein